jgi:hypothetical protein
MDNVIKLHKRPRLDIKKYGEEKFCQHNYIEVGQYSREVRCQTCHAALDPTDVIIQFANKERSFEHTREAAQQLGDRVTLLKKQEKNIKARIRNAEKRLAKTEE